MPKPHALTTQKIVELLKAERLRLNWSQESLAVAAGVSNSCIRHPEHSRASPTMVTLLKLAGALELDLADLLRSVQAPEAKARAKALRLTSTSPRAQLSSGENPRCGTASARLRSRPDTGVR